MSAPDSSDSNKAPPSLLSDKENAAQANGSRILANLEGRVAPPPDKPQQRSRAPIVIVALLVIAAGGWGAWHLQHRGEGQTATVAAVPVPASANPVAPVAASATAQVMAKADNQASAPQAATIISEDTTNKAASDSTAAGASGADGDNRLSRALASGAEEASGVSPPAASAVSASAVAVPAAAAKTTLAGSSAKHAASSARAKREAANAHHASSATAVAQAKKPAARDAKSGARTDSDADLLAALVARTKPAGAKTDTAAAKSARAAKAAPPAAASAPATTLAQRVKECGARGFFDEQMCRWHVCDGHWGKDPACPNANQAHQP
ncbi:MULTISPECIES: hypothetical protein [Paraburkholderia]|uniref:hypothetical protein n=1 Tax=Paraburkholderia TaxID=1822464 RepID=UPI0022510DD8|nr:MULTISPECIES: hypothetical protein [Paraburkholderia]MCX4165017.1 hypothetical protein [Paraburkholderia megapolitana]MDN7160510.1 hypothetical protein [Paraburkholderia sp. CHISQ3]MDQ6497557.1 hypothetical protein [Paraburkholderia megapolitana]